MISSRGIDLPSFGFARVLSSCEFQRSLLTTLLKFCGWTVAHTPEGLWRVVSRGLGDAILVALPKRRRVLDANLHHAFPERPQEWRRRMARESSRRMVETGLLSLASPYFSEERILRSATLAPAFHEYVRERLDHERPAVYATVHAAYWETQVWLPLLAGRPVGPIGVFYRPLKQPAVDAYVKRTRERFGMTLLSRRAGFQGALRFLRDKGAIALLFDQNAGDEGSLTLLLDRVCATSDLAGVFASKFGADVRAVYTRRTGFWRMQLQIEPIAHDGTAADVTLALNAWLERTLRTDEEFCASWLWMHERWRTQDRPERRLRLQQKRDLLADDLRRRGQTSLPRRTRIFIRLPNWLGDVVMALPLLRAVRTSRPDAELTLIGKAAFAPLVNQAGAADRFLPLPPRGRGYFRFFRGLRHDHPDTYVLFTQSVRGDLEAWLTGCAQRFGLVRGGRKRPLLTHRYAPPPGYDERQHHQLELWTEFLRHFGLQTEADRTPLRTPASSARAPLGLIAGSENTPAKRWPVEHWRQLIESCPSERFVLFGTRNDQPITAAIASGFAADRVENLAGRTDLTTYMDRLAGCELLVTNDTGGMHLANALGVPLIGLFGPTNPIRTGPVFSAPFLILQPPGCPPTGGGDLQQLTPEAVVAGMEQLRGQLAER